MFVSVVGFPPEQSKSPSSSTHRGVRRQRSLLSESLRSNSVLSMSRENSLSSMGSAELVGSYTSNSSTSESEDSCEQLQQHIGESQFGESTAVPIPYTSAARARIDKAEAQGRRRDEQLEMLHAVRQYMAQTKAHAKALQAQC